MTSGIKAPQGAILSPVQAVMGRAMCMLAFWRASSRQSTLSSCRHWIWNCPSHESCINFTDWLNILNSTLFLKWAWFGAHKSQIYPFPLSTLEPILLKSSSGQLCTMLSEYAGLSCKFTAHSQDFLLKMVLRHTHACAQLHLLLLYGQTVKRSCLCINSLKNSYIQFYALSLGLFIWVHAMPQTLEKKIFQRLIMVSRRLWTTPAKWCFLSCGSFFVFLPAFSCYFIFSPNWLPPCILSVANHFRFCNHWP